MKRQRLIQGNEACAHGALYAGCSFYAGYPITPSSEIMEILAQEMPAQGRVFIQMEDEIASISAIIGGAWGGAKVLTATSGPGFSLMQEGIGYASITETPCVIINCQRWGPSTGQPTKAAQGDVMQAIWGTHGDHAVIVLTASNVRDAFEMTVRAFNLAEEYRVPVILLIDEVLAHMRENIAWPEPGELPVVNRRAPESTAGFKPFADEGFLPFGAGSRYHVTGMAHGPEGFVAHGEAAARELRRMIGKIQDRVKELAVFEAAMLDDAEVAIVSYGITSRPARAAADQLRAEGVRAGCLDIKTLWPFPEHLIADIAGRVDRIVMPELNLGQLVREVERAAGGRCEVRALGRIDGSLMTPQQICDAARSGKLQAVGQENSK
ncbi:2-oxoglutarate/2-oxoacid ferredoxin oxidoreductase subunit alpha [Phycisphaerales bacterium]|nr:2-oxoglutarate/2-oxoacid ferredoxin oxidoreductase subunit alpha [Phycisphaerales bacterium]